MNNEKITILYKEPLKEPEIKIIENSIESIENVIGGKVSYTIFEGMHLFYDKEAKSKGLKLNIAIDSFTSIYGNIVLVIKKKESDSFISLTRDECVYYKSKLLNKAFKSTKKEKLLLPRIKMVINWDNVVNAKPEAKIKQYNERMKEMNIENKTKLSDEEIAKRVREILLKIKNDPRLTEEEKSEQTRKIIEKLKTVKGISFTEIKEEPKTDTKSSGNSNVITTTDKSVNEIPVFDANEVLKMILAMQNTIIKFIKDNTEEQ